MIYKPATKKVFVFFIFLIPFFSSNAEISPLGEKSQKIELKELKYDDFCFLIENSDEIINYRSNSKEKERLDELFHIENEKQYCHHIFNRYRILYNNYAKKALLSNPNKILISFPNNMKGFFASFSNNGIINNTIVRQNRFVDYFSYNCDFNDGHNVKWRVSFLLDKDTKSTLIRSIKYSIDKAEGAQSLSSWSSVPIVDTPFDFTFNFSPSRHTEVKTGKQTITFNIIASCYNLMVSFLIEIPANNSLKDIQSIFNDIVSLFDGYSNIAKTNKVDYLELNPVFVLSSEQGNKLKIPCKFKAEHISLKDNFWILAVSDKGILSVDKAEFKAMEWEFRKKNYSIESINKFFKDAREIPDTVFLSLPEGEKTAELTFYFISEDGKQYSSQSITLTVPETEKESTSTK